MRPNFFFSQSNEAWQGKTRQALCTHLTNRFHLAVSSNSSDKFPACHSHAQNHLYYYRKVPRLVMAARDDSLLPTMDGPGSRITDHCHSGAAYACFITYPMAPLAGLHTESQTLIDAFDSLPFATMGLI